MDIYKEEYDKWKKYKKMIRENKFYLLFKTKEDLVKKLGYKYFGLNLEKINNPETYTEKLQRRKLINNDLFVICADKQKVREYVANKIGEEYLIPQYLCKKKITEKDLEKLPNQFIIKSSNGSGTNQIIYSKRKTNLKELSKLMNFYTTIEYGTLWGEFYYNKGNTVIVAEKLLKDKNGNLPNDLKIHCFNNGNEKHKIIESYYKVDGKLHKNIYDENWNVITEYVFGFSSTGKKIKKPKNLDEILYISEKLSEDTNYVRVDLYNVDNKLYFGELTFIPGAGYAKFNNEYGNKLWGKYMGEEK